MAAAILVVMVLEVRLMAAAGAACAPELMAASGMAAARAAPAVIAARRERVFGFSFVDVAFIVFLCG